MKSAKFEISDFSVEQLKSRQSLVCRKWVLPVFSPLFSMAGRLWEMTSQLLGDYTLKVLNNTADVCTSWVPKLKI